MHSPTRRTLLRSLLTASVLVAGCTGRSAPTGEQRSPSQRAHGEPVTFRWRVPSAHYQTVEDALRFEGIVEQERDTKGLQLVMVFVGVALLLSLVDAILVLRRKLVQPGLKIDARGAEIKIEVDPTLPRGTIVLCDQTRCKLYEPDQLTNPAELVKALADARAK